MTQKNKYSRRSVKDTGIKNVTIYPTGKRKNDSLIKDLKTIGIKLKGKDQIIKFAKSILDMADAGHEEINITGWRKSRSITFTGSHEKVG